MPIEIKELHIKTVIDDSDAGRRDNSDGCQPIGDRDQLIAECVEQVLEILNLKGEP